MTDAKNDKLADVDRQQISITEPDKKLFELAIQVRSEAEGKQCQGSQQYSFFTSKCHLTSELLLKRAQERGFKNVRVESGFFYSNPKECHNHSWIVYKKKWIIDLTADQFENVRDKLIIANIHDKRYVPASKVNIDRFQKEIIPCLL